MRATILGSAAGGGFPQWNCGCPGCVAVREGREGFVARTQDSVAVTGDGERYVLFNASPDILAQIKKTPALWPRGPRHSPIAAIVLTNGDMDHVLGLFSLRESYPFEIWATRSVWSGLEQNIFLRTLRRFEGHTEKRILPLDADVTVAGLRLRARAAPGKAPVHVVDAATSADNVMLSVDGKLLYAAACASTDVDLGGHQVVLFDGTFYREDELVRLGLSKAVAKDMAHVPVTSSLAMPFAAGVRKIYTHINNTNPILDPASDERRAAVAAGWEVAYDGMEIDA